MKSKVEPAPAWTAWLFIAVSALLHASVAWAVTALFTVPSLDLELVLPMDVEIGLSHEVALGGPLPSEPAPVAATPPPSEVPVDNSQGEAAEPKKKPKKKKHTPRDGGIEADAGAAPERLAAHDAGVPEPTLQSATGTLPQGTQIAVRVDLTRVRNSPIADDARRLLAAIPDWQQLLDGSGIEPIEQLDRLLIATPNLERAKLVLAGRVFPDAQPEDMPGLAERAVQNLAAARQIEANWRVQDGVRVAPWANRDSTPRVIAMLDRLHFAIAREEDLPRILAIASARASDERVRSQDGGVALTPADALLSMNEGEGLSLEVDGVERFVPQRNAGIPQRLRISAVEISDVPPRLSLRLQLTFEDPQKAAAGLRFWDKIRRFYAGNALIAMLGLAAPLDNATLEVSENDVRASVELSVEQTRMILGYVRELVTPAPRPPAP